MESHNQQPCPACGHCPTCGRGAAPYRFYYPTQWWVPTYQSYPWTLTGWTLVGDGTGTIWNSTANGVTALNG